MAIYNVTVFLLHCYIPTSLLIGNVVIEPFEGSGIMDVADLIDRYAERVLKQPSQPPEQKAAMSEKIRDDGASAVITFQDVEAENHIEAIKATEGALLLCRDIVALRQWQRGVIAGFLVLQTDVDPYQLFSQVRRPYPILRKVQNLPIFDAERDIVARFLIKAVKHPLLKVYLSFYADTLAYSDTLVTETSLETRLLKTWTFLEAMAFSEPGTKKQKVKALFKRYQIPYYPDYRNHLGKELLDIAYEWRNVIAHSGGCRTAANSTDKQFCQTYQVDFGSILDDLSECCRMLLHAYANALP